MCVGVWERAIGIRLRAEWIGFQGKIVHSMYGGMCVHKELGRDSKFADLPVLILT